MFNKKIKILRAKKTNLIEISQIASETFSGLKDKKTSAKWIKCNLESFPRTQYFIAVLDKQVAGYILWIEKGGFRKESVFELEQIAVKKEFQGQGIGKKLINDSLIEIKKYLKKRKSSLKIIEVTTGSNNYAQKLYKDTLGAQPECTIKDFFREDEVIMISRFKNNS